MFVLTLDRFKDEEGQGLVEYALIISLIVLVVFGALKTLGIELNGFFEIIGNNTKSFL